MNYQNYEMRRFSNSTEQSENVITLVMVLGSDVSFNDGVFTMALCPPNIKVEACRECLNNTIPYLIKSCPKQKEGVAWTALAKVTCIVTYRDSSFSRGVPEWAWTSFSSPPNQTPTSAVDLEKGLNTLADKLKGAAAAGGIHQKFAFEKIAYGPGPKGSWPLYGYMQCTPNIGQDTCSKCLTDSTSAIHNCCSKTRRLAGIALGIHCYCWYAHSDFTPKTLPTVSFISLQT
ncbi:hypothetical protein SSX86_008763 [Deinandra increscens subsp. villosa]|uniref:Gnk2-homologous domain-containing protein n=1 Tax=Deinandra increscens subsp. villosa TaxID=3103831 RepID=A0AAP0H746_9ASTR